MVGVWKNLSLCFSYSCNQNYSTSLTCKIFCCREQNFVKPIQQRHQYTFLIHIWVILRTQLMNNEIKMALNVHVQNYSTPKSKIWCRSFYSLKPPINVAWKCLEALKCNLKLSNIMKLFLLYNFCESSVDFTIFATQL